ncbi:RagB/SusD family nutrient uptake outer membrane protein [Chitinophaga sp. S165]|uniref:RagB/SusD family nutrient uptake outer membrane protein n=1 Tax=Chitinophaga sp. S165 TaxID=2135462 RepID=UPI000D70D200|nr:RagB/SusD family nutrient uptake outer membrane protein [Chitinophaga sp. S165]PWV53532.1 SusD-like starch-binding protein associating with outer membrane [Chitinophaga sp. S165]
MKKYYILIIIVMAGLMSCKKWLEVTPQTDISQDVLFSTQAGFEEALNGVYSRCVGEDSYGKELSFGFPEVLAQNYSITPDDPRGYRQAALYNYDDDQFIYKRDAAWLALYAAIANSNLILHHIEGKERLFSGREYELIKGEALALRAYLHFDLLRMFGPSYANDPVAPAIPYVKDFSNKITPMSTVTGVLDSAIQDLNAAKQLLKVADPILDAGYKVGYPVKDSSTEENGPLFLQNRRHRLNYYAVCGELARVLLYRGNKAEALANALEVINSNKFPWTRQNDFLNPDDEKKDRVLYRELLFAWYIPNGNLTKVINDWFRDGDNALFITSTEGRNLYETGGVGGEDNRFKQWFSEKSGGLGTRMQLEKYYRDPDRNMHYLVAPALRLSEMYYIAAECTFDADPEKAWSYFNTVRFNRGIGRTITNETSKDVFLNELVKESRKEFYGEGQIFYTYKRLNKPIIGFAGATNPATNRIFVIPLPDDEIQFGNR